MSFADADDMALTTPQSAPLMDDNALTTPHDPTMDLGRTAPHFSPSGPPAIWPHATSPYQPDGVPLAPPPPLYARRNVVRAAIAGMSIVVVLALLASIAFVANHRGIAGASDSAATVAGSYCRLLGAAQYPQGYALWDASLGAGIASADYAAISKDIDAQAGSVTGCVVGKTTTSGSIATVAVTLTRQTSGAQTLTWQLNHASAGWRFAQYPEPSFAARVTLRHYCTAVVGGQYSAAYGLFTPTLQQHLLSADVYAGVAGEADAAAGKATACATTGVDVAANGTASGHLTLTRSQPDAETVSLAAATTGTAPITASPDVSLPARITARTFCAAMVKKDYGAAFALFTPSAQSAIGSANDFGNRIGIATTLTGDITGCHIGAFTLNADNQSGMLSGQVTTHPFFGDQTHTTTLTMVASATDVWLIDDATIDGLSLSSGIGLPFGRDSD